MHFFHIRVCCGFSKFSFHHSIGSDTFFYTMISNIPMCGDSKPLENAFGDSKPSENAWLASHENMLNM